MPWPNPILADFSGNPGENYIKAAARRQPLLMSEGGLQIAGQQGCTAATQRHDLLRVHPRSHLSAGGGGGRWACNASRGVFLGVPSLQGATREHKGNLEHFLERLAGGGTLSRLSRAAQAVPGLLGDLVSSAGGSAGQGLRN